MAGGQLDAAWGQWIGVVRSVVSSLNLLSCARNHENCFTFWRYGKCGLLWDSERSTVSGCPLELSK